MFPSETNIKVGEAECHLLTVCSCVIAKAVLDTCMHIHFAYVSWFGVTYMQQTF